jgi:hypothetical protein
MAIKVYTEKLFGYASEELRTHGFIQWFHDCMIDAGFAVIYSTVGGNGTGTHNASDNWIGSIRSPEAHLAYGNYCIFKHPDGVNQIQIGRYNQSNYYRYASCSVSSKNGFNLAGGGGTEIALPACNTAEDRVILSQHLTETGGYDRIVFAADATSNYKLYLITDSPDSFICIIRTMSTNAILTVFGSLKLTDTTDSDYPFVNFCNLNTEASSTDAYYGILGNAVAGLSQLNQLGTPTTKLGGLAVHYQVSNSSPSSDAWHNAYRLPFDPFNNQFIEEEILMTSKTPEFLLRGKVPLVRYVQTQVPDGTISADGTRAVIGSLSYPWDISTATMW